MWRILVQVFLFHYVESISSSIKYIPVISNVSLQMLGYNSTTINGTCDECLCTMLLNATSISSFNCFQNNKTCEIFSAPLTTNSFSFINNSASSVYFLSLLITSTTSTISTSTITSTTSTRTTSTDTTTSTISTSTITSTTSTRTTTSSSTSTSSASTTSRVSTTTTTQNSQLAYFNPSVTSNWTPSVYVYFATTSQNVTLTFIFQTNKKDIWYLDNVSVQDLTWKEMLVNGNFDNSSLLVGWTESPTSCSSTDYGLSSTQYHSSNKSYSDSCDGHPVTIYQSFPVISGEFYNIVFWYYFDDQPGGGGSPVQMNVTIN